jgi:hypothetical protein
MVLPLNKYVVQVPDWGKAQRYAFAEWISQGQMREGRERRSLSDRCSSNIIPLCSESDEKNIIRILAILKMKIDM